MIEAAAAARSAAAGEAGKDAYVRGMFSAIAPRYDLLNRVLSFNFDRRWRRRAIAALDVGRKPEGRYLDLCAGTLDVAAAIATLPGFQGSVVGADFSEAMLLAGLGSKVESRKSKDTTGRVAPVVADAQAMPLAAASCAGAIVAFGIRNVSDLGVALREAHRVLEPGAKFVILEFNTPRNWFFRTGYHAYFRVVLPRIGALVSGHKTAYSYLPESVAHFPSPEALGAKLQQTGFTAVRWESMMFGVVVLHVGTKAS